MEETKICCVCKKEKTLEKFYRNANNKDGREYQCKMCCKKRIAKWRKENPEKCWEQWLKRKYNITPTDYDEMLETQEGVCAICGKTPEENGKRLAVDHCHSTGKVRGLLCSNCNWSIGSLQDDPDLLRSAADYIEWFK